MGGIVLVLVVWLGWAFVKGCWSSMTGGGEEIDVGAEMMKTWQQHLEQRWEAFGDGLPEQEVVAKGLRNYSWEGWQTKCQKEQAAKPKPQKKETDADAGGWRNFGSQSFEVDGITIMSV